MPHVIVKLWPGRTQEQKQRLADAIAQTLKDTIDVEDSSISVAIEEIPRESWVREVYKPDIMDKEAIIYKKPGYKPAESEF